MPRYYYNFSGENRIWKLRNIYFQHKLTQNVISHKMKKYKTRTKNKLNIYKT